MTNKFYAELFLLALFFTENAEAQVDDFRMRYEQEYAQLKSQEIALIPQKIYRFSRDHTQHLHTSLTDLLSNQTSFYLAKLSIYPSEIYYQNRKTSPTIAIHNVDFSSSILENNFHFIQTLHPFSFESIQVNQGYAVSQLQYNSSQIALDFPIHPEKRDSFGLQIKTLAGGGNSDYSGFFQLALHRRKLNYVLNAYGGQNFRYKLGVNPQPSLTWRRIANPFHGTGLGSWTFRADSLVNIQPQVFLGIDNLINIKTNNQNELNFYLHLEGRQETNLGNTIQRNDRYLLSESNTSFNPMVHAFVQKVNYSEYSPFFTQLNVALAYQHLTNQTNKRYDIQDELYRQHYEENKISLQARAHKNFNAKHILFYGSEISTTFLKNKFHLDDAFTSFFDQPITKFTSYIKFEKRQSADISWFIGAKGGFENTSFRHAPFVVIKNTMLRPQGELNLSWHRHICESSNYLINIFLRSKAPSLAEFNPIYQHIFLIPNPNLKNETELLFESHLYRKFEDKFEVHLSPYFRYSWNTILLRDNYGNPNKTLKYGLNKYFTQQYTNPSHLSEGGAHLELRYNVSKKILAYHQISFQHVWTPLDSHIFYPSLPLYGNLGVKYKSNNLFLHTWMHFNGGRSFSDSTRSQYVQYYANQNGRQKEFPAYFDLNLAIQYQFVKNLSAQLNIENIFDQNGLDFLSTLPNQGRRFRLQLMYSL